MLNKQNQKNNIQYCPYSVFFFFSSRRRHTILQGDWSSDVCSSDLVHDVCDFISTVDTPSVWELNIWYHTLNCGYRCRISGETDFPCIYGERVGLGRSYVHLPGKLRFEDWAEGIKNGRSYVGDGKSHLMDFTVNGLGVGLQRSEILLNQAGTVNVRANVAALLEPESTEETERIRKAPLTAKPY